MLMLLKGETWVRCWPSLLTKSAESQAGNSESSGNLAQDPAKACGLIILPQVGIASIQEQLSVLLVLSISVFHRH